MAQAANTKKERGKFLTIMLIFLTCTQGLGGLSAVIEVLGNIWLLIIAHITRSYDPKLAGAFIGDVVAVMFIVFEFYGLWRWKRWGVYLFALSIPFGIYAYREFLHTFDISKILFWAGLFLYAGLSSWAISRKWKYFT